MVLFLAFKMYVPISDRDPPGLAFSQQCLCVSFQPPTPPYPLPTLPNYLGGSLFLL